MINSKPTEAKGTDVLTKLLANPVLGSTVKMRFCGGIGAVHGVGTAVVRHTIVTDVVLKEPTTDADHHLD